MATGQKKITLKRNNFNKLFWKLWQTKDDPRRFILNRGGFGSGKSVSVAQYIITRCMRNRGFKVLVSMKHSNSLSKTVMEEFNTQLKKFKMYDEVKIHLQEKRYTFPNGSVIVFCGLDDYEKLKGIPNIQMVYIEEATNITQGDFDALNGRLRGSKYTNVNRQMILNFNPTSITNWVYKRFYDEMDRDNCIYLKTTFDDNVFIDDEYKESQRRYEKLDYNEYKIRVLGEWGTTKSGHELFPHFKVEKHVTKCKYDPSKPLFLTFDENRNPYLTCLVAQVDGKEVRFIKEILAKDPFNTERDICNMIKNEYPQHNEGLFIHGDATSWRKDVRSEGDFYSILLQHLEQYRPKVQTPRANPGVAIRSTWLNEIFFDGRDDIKIKIDSSCTTFITDLQVVKQDSDGTMLKKKVKDKETGLTYEEAGHCFVGETLIKTDKGDKRIDEIKIDDKVLTRKGYKKVINTFNNGLREVKTYKIGDNTITCTPDHKVYTKENGFIEIDSIENTKTFTIFVEKDLCEIPLFIEELTSTDIQKPKQDPKEYITQVGLKSMVKEKRNTVVENVYDIEVEDEHEYFANNILVHNCTDAFSYIICELFKTDFDNYRNGGSIKINPKLNYKPKKTMY